MPLENPFKHRRTPSTDGEPDYANLSHRDLRALVGRWREGETLAAQKASYAKAQRAQQEIDARAQHLVALMRKYRAEFNSEYLAEREVEAVRRVVPGRFTDGPRVAPPWEQLKKKPRVVRWQRPTGSTNYPSDESIAQARMRQTSRDFWRQK